MAEDSAASRGAGAGPAAPVDPDRPTSSLAVHIAWIMDVLERNLEAKSKIYSDPSLSCVFLLNNGRYIIQKVKDSELEVLLGDEWMRRMMARVRRWGGEYQRATWGKVVAVLHLGSAGATAATAKSMKERLRIFNNYFEEICREQSGWVAADEQELRREAKGMPDAGRDKYVKYTPDDVEARINRLFEGTVKK
uniref:Exocyst subunit Exo70 family protein n=1 Tax=Ananas comosus var. bracteatus TaxID=296719 RepID=A0A6V7QRN6_ANACO